MKLELYLRSLKITQVEFARRAGITQSVVSEVISKRREISIEKAVRIQLASSNVVTVADLLGRSNIKKISNEIERRLKKC